MLHSYHSCANTFRMLDTHRIGSLVGTNARAADVASGGSSVGTNTASAVDEDAPGPTLGCSEGGRSRILVIHGTRDDIIPVVRASAFVESLLEADAAQVVVLEILDADHAVYSSPQLVQETTRIVRDWLGGATESLGDAQHEPALWAPWRNSRSTSL
jgi:hypothetical protein